MFGNGNHSLWDRDEPRYAQATREMLRSGDYVLPTFNTDIRYDKPPLTYWMMAVPMKVFGISDWSARLPAAVMGAARTALIFQFALAIGCSIRGASVATVITILSGLLLLVSKAATTDSILIFFTILAIYAYYMMMTRGQSLTLVLLFWAAIGFAILVKGPPGPAIVGLLVISHQISRRLLLHQDIQAEELTFHTPTKLAALRHVIGFGLMLLVALPWAVAITLQTDGDFLRTSIGRHVVERVKEPAEGHAGPFFYYIALLPALLLPFTALTINAVGRSVNRFRHEPDLFLWCWFIPGLIMFSVVSTKLPHYVAPLIPAIALMVGLWWTEREIYREEFHFQTPLRIIGGVITLLAGLAVLIGLPIAAYVMDLPYPFFIFPLAAISLGGLLVAGSVSWLRRRDRSALSFWSFSIIAGLAIGLLIALPSIDSMRPSKQIARTLRDIAPPNTQLALMYYQEPSLVFYWGDPILMIGRQEMDVSKEFLTGNHPAAMITTESRYESHAREWNLPPDSPISVKYKGTFYQVEKGRMIDLVIVGNWPNDEEKKDSTE